jgi:hypothetical protein
MVQELRRVETGTALLEPLNPVCKYFASRMMRLYTYIALISKGATEGPFFAQLYTGRGTLKLCRTNLSRQLPHFNRRYWEKGGSNGIMSTNPGK